MKDKIRLIQIGGPSEPSDYLITNPDASLAEFLSRVPALSASPVTAEQMRMRLGQLNIMFVTPAPNSPVYIPPGLRVTAGPEGSGPSTAAAATATAATVAGTNTDGRGQATVDVSVPMPVEINDEFAVRMAYRQEIESVASFLRVGLSALVVCEKLVVDHLAEEIVRRAAKRAVVLKVPDEDEGGLVPRGLRQRQLAKLKTSIRDLKAGDVLVIPHLDLLAGGSDQNLPTESRELIELVYEEPGRLVLGFADRSLNIPEVLASRFAVRLSISGVPRVVVTPDGKEQPIGSVLVTADEASHFEGFDPEALYKNVAGMNPVRLRHAVIYAVKEHAGGGKVPVSRLYHAIRAFKAQTSNSFEVPDVSFEQIGGYEDVKDEILRAIQMIDGSASIPDEKLRQELIPRGFLLHGPPGTGKTLFAKAVANRMNATIQIVSGPEVTDMYVGESERKVRELFAEARRNAPAVLVFDEFDAIATKRSGREDGGSRAGNAIVAQILTEMDGFRPDVPMLVIGTTNRLDIIDEALLRPSRFRAIPIGLPDLVARRAIAQVHSRRFKLDIPDELLEVIAASTNRFNGDQIRSLFRDAYVSVHLEKKPATARRFGQLVGRIRQEQQDRDAVKTGRLTPAGVVLRPGDRPRPSGTMQPLALRPAARSATSATAVSAQGSDGPSKAGPAAEIQIQTNQGEPR